MNQIKYGYARWLNNFHQYFIPTTKATTEWSSRSLETAIVMAPDRMVDAADDMMKIYRKNDNSGHIGISSSLPVVITALSKDYMPIGGEISRQIAKEIDVVFPQDSKERVFKIRQIKGERRAQLLFVASEDASARSMAMQFCQWLSDFENRRFTVPYHFAGIVHEWPVMLETTDVMASPVDFGQKNVTGLIVDVNLRETIPIFMAPKSGEPNDGLGTDGDESDPSGYTCISVISEANIQIAHNTENKQYS